MKTPKNLVSRLRIFGILTIAFLFSTPALARLNLADNYESYTGCVKQKILWDEVIRTEHKGILPPLKKFGFGEYVKMGVQWVAKKKTCYDDVAPKRWDKYLHRRGAMAMVKIVPIAGGKGTGVFAGAPCALLRLSLTFRPDDKDNKRNVAPGLALKVLRDGIYSTNVSALYALEGQQNNYNFFANPLSNIVPLGLGAGAKLVHDLFFDATDYPEELLVNEMTNMRADGKKAENPLPIRQIFFEPNSEFKGAAGNHDVRKDMLKIPEGSVLYTIKAMPKEFLKYPYSRAYTTAQIKGFNEKAIPIAKIVTTSPFMASSFGDTGIFFRHEMRPKTEKK